MGKQATINNRLRASWHRAKSISPNQTTEKAWFGCGDYGNVDSQNHWIRECSANHIRSIRLDTKEQARKQLENTRMCKFKKDIRQEIFSVCSELLETTFHGEEKRRAIMGRHSPRIYG